MVYMDLLHMILSTLHGLGVSVYMSHLFNFQVLLMMTRRKRILIMSMATWVLLKNKK